MNLIAGDTVYCKVRGYTIVPVSYEKWDAEIPLDIIGISPDGFYILFVPPYYNIKHSWKIDSSHMEDCGIDKKYKGRHATAVPKEKIARVVLSRPTEKNGTVCIKCGRFSYMSEPNQDDGTFICYTCRTN